MKTLMTAFLTTLALVSMSAIPGVTQAADGKSFSPEPDTNPNIIRAQKAREAAYAAETAQRHQDARTKTALGEEYIRKVGRGDRAYGLKQWYAHGVDMNLGALRKFLGAVAVVAVTGTAVGLSPEASAASVRVQSDTEDAAVNVIGSSDVTAPGAVSGSFKSATPTKSSAGTTR